MTYMLPLLALFVPSTARAADQADTITKLINADNHEAAAKKCDKWGAASSSSPANLREACAEAEWDFARRQGTVEEWARYRKRWAGTSFEAKAHEQEANKALLALGVKASEDEFRKVAESYDGTKAGADAMVKAAYAAFRTVSTSEDARRVVERYPQHEDAANVTMKFLDAFVEILFTEDGYDVALSDKAVVPEGSDVSSNWVARYADGSISSWAQDARQQLLAGGVPESLINEAAAQAKEGDPAFPLCFNPSAPDGWAVGVMVTLGRGSAFKAAPLDASCDETTPPVFVVADGGKVTGLSLRPDHLAHFPTSKPADGAFAWGAEDTVDLYVPGEPGTPVLVKDVLAQPLGGKIYMVHPMSGGLPWWWITSKAPPGSISLDGGIHASVLHGEWKVEESANGSKVTGPGLEEGQTWMLPKGKAGALPPMVQKVTGLNAGNYVIESATEPLPEPAKSAWKLPARKPVADPDAPTAAVVPRAGEAAAPDYGPPGSTGLALQAIDKRDLASVARPLTGAGLSVEPLRGWKLNLDDDAGDEVLVEAKVDDRGVRFLLDPPDKGLNRVFAFDVMAATRLEADQDVVFAFEKEGTAYLGIIAPAGASGAELSAWHLGEATLEHEPFEVSTWAAP